MFRSDNVVGAIPEILDALERAAARAPLPYGDDELDHRLEQKLSELFETKLRCFAVATGTAANALSLATLSPPWGAIYCHPEAHPNCDECGAPEAMSHAKLIPVGGDAARIDPLRLRQSISAKGNVHRVQPAVLSLSQATECGTVYRVDQLEALTELARHHQLRVHLDGARFANALATLGCAPSALTWRAGVDLLSLGFTKNGALCAELIVAFHEADAERLAFSRKRFGHLFSKAWFVSAQILALLENDRWLALARHANAMASRLSTGLALLGIQPLWPCEANAVFLRLDSACRCSLRAAGFAFYDWPGIDDAVRLICSFRTTQSEVDAFLAAVSQCSTRPH